MIARSQLGAGTTALMLVGIAALLVLLRLPGLALPLERDEGAYAYVAWNWLAGGVPYRSAFDHKPPLIYLLYMPALLADLPLTLNVRIWATLLALLATALVFVIGRQVWSRGPALLAALIWAVAGSAFQLQGLVLNTDQALVVPALLALWCALQLHRSAQLRYAVAAGAALAVAALIKPVAILLAPALLLASQPRLNHILGVAGAAAAGAALVAGPLVTYFVAVGAWHDLVFGLVTYNALYAAEARAGWQLGALVDMLPPFVPLLVTALGGLSLVVGRRNTRLFMDRRAVMLVAAWCGALLFAAAGSLRAFVHYYYPALPFLALLAAPTLVWLWPGTSPTSQWERLGSRLAPLALGALLLFPFARQNVALIGSTAAQQAEQLYGADGRFYFAPAPEVAAYVRAHTAAGEPIYVFAAEPEVYVLAERRSSSRFIFDYPLILMPGLHTILERELAADPPALVLSYVGVRTETMQRLLEQQAFAKQAEIGGYEIFGPRR